MKGLKIIDTGDGSHSLYHEGLNETYHSRHGAIQESSHVFLKMGFEAHPANPLSILEYGFGTGLNALLTAVAASQQKRTITYTTLEAFPLEDHITNAINYGEMLSHPDAEAWFDKLHGTKWGATENIHPHFSLQKIKTTFENFHSDQHFDIIYFDAFAPSRQPELWDKNMLNKVCRMIKTGGIFVTYSAMGQLKRDLSDLGLKVESLEGPPGKKEMVRAWKA